MCCADGTLWTEKHSCFKDQSGRTSGEQFFDVGDKIKIQCGKNFQCDFLKKCNFPVVHDQHLNHH